MKNNLRYNLLLGISKPTLVLIILALFGFNFMINAQTLVWEENFNSTTLNSTTWTYDFGNGSGRAAGWGWGNSELEYYTSRTDNVRIENGSLLIEAKRENFDGSSFTSGRIKTEGRLHFKYGTVEARIKLPNMANGLWPAFWTLGTIGGSWPSIGEIDIMEAGAASAIAANLVNKRISSATHWSNASGGHVYNAGSKDAALDLSVDYHLYKMVWTSQFIKMYLDNVEFYSFNTGTDPNLTEFHNPHFLLLNLAVGGGYTGIFNENGITATLPGKMYVDYIRLYQNPGDELILGNDVAVTGNFGVLTETTPVSASLDYGTNAVLNYWNNISTITTPVPVPFEGTKLWAVHANAGDWFGMGVVNNYVNLQNFSSGSLKFNFKSTYTGQFKIGLTTGHGETWMNFSAGTQKYGLVRDGNWHEVTIPLADFNNPAAGMNIDLLTLKSAFMFAGDAPTSGADFFIDNIYFYKTGGTTSSAPTIPASTPPVRVSTDVISLFSNAYTNLLGTDWFPNWGQTTIVADTVIGGNSTKIYSNLNFQGVQFTPSVNAGSMTKMHLDLWTSNVTAFDVSIINPGPIEKKVTLTPNLAGWNSFDIDLNATNFPGINFANILQLKLEGRPASGKVYMDNLYFYKPPSLPAISPSTAAPNPPVRNFTDVLSLFSGAYMDKTGTDWFPNWGQSTIVADNVIVNNNTKKYSNFNYQGVQFSSPANAENMRYLHLDIWTPNCTSLQVFLINTSPALVEQSVTLTPTFSGWNSFDIALTQYNTIALVNVSQLKLVGLPSGTSSVYLDNIYFWKPANVPTLSNFIIPAKVVGDAPFAITAPTSNSIGTFTYTSSNTSVATISGSIVTVKGVGTTVITATQAATATYVTASTTAPLVVSFSPPLVAAPTPPVRNAADVVSLFSEAYTNVAGTNWFPNWGQSTVVTDIMVAGNVTKKYDNLNYQGVEFAGTVNVGAMQNLHLDIWTPNCTSFEVFLINTIPSTVEKGFIINLTNTGWNSIDIPLSYYNTINLTTVTQIKLVGTPFGGSIVYIDNIYFWKGVAAPSLSVTQTTCSVATGTITVTSPTAGLAFSLNGGSFSNSTGIFSSLVPGTYTVRAKNAANQVSPFVNVVINPIETLPSAPSAIVGVKNVSQCDTLQSYTVINNSSVTYAWSVAGTGNSVKSGQGTNAVVLVMKSAGTISVYARNSCANVSPTTTFAVTKSIPTTPGYIYKAFLPSLVSAATNVCSYTASVVASTGVRDTFRIKQVAFATGYIWEAPGGSFVTLVNDTTIAVTFPDTITLSSTSPRYIKVYSLSACDTSLPRVLTLTRTLPTAPGVIQSSFSPSVAAVTEVCSSIGGSPITYRIRKAANATSYNWSLKVGSNATLVHLNGFGVNDTAVTVVYNTGFTKDTISVKSVNGCSVSLAKTLAVSAIMAPPAATNITSSTGNFNACAGNSVQYTVVAPAPTATQGTVMVYRWTIPAKTSITSANADSSVITLNFQTSFAGGSLSVKALSGCGIYSASKVASFIPPTPTGITSSTASYNACIGNVIQYTVVPTAATPLKATTHHYRWTIPAKTMISATNADSSVISVTFLSLYTGGNLTVKGVTVCGVAGSAKSQPLTHTGCPSGTRESIVKAQEITLNKAQLYPNPNNGTFNLNIETGINTTMPASVQIVDAFGRRVAQYNTMNTAGKMNKNIAENALAPGLYTVVYTVGSKTGSIKMIVVVK